MSTANDKEQKNTINISLILPFRERVFLLEEMLKSLVENSGDLSKIEVLIYIDNDEPRFKEFDRIVNHYNKFVCIKYFVRERSIHFTRDYLNPLARKARGRWVIPLNDDCDFPTKDWDLEVHKCMHEASLEYKDEILLGLPKDQIPRKNENIKYPHFSSFPVVPKKVIDVLGYLWDERCYVWGPDHIIAQIFRELAGSTRLVSLTHITIGHNSAHTGRRKVHENYEYFNNIDQKYQVTIGTMDKSEAIEKLRKALEC